MRIGIDATCWANERGYGRYTREIVSAMAPQAPSHEFICFLDELSARTFALRGPNIVARPLLRIMAGILRHVGGRIAASIEGNRAIAPAEEPYLRRPASRFAGELVNEDHRDAVPSLFVVEIDAVDEPCRHVRQLLSH